MTWYIRNGTNITDLNNIGIKVITSENTGMPSVTNIFLPHAVTDGSTYQRNRIPVRYISLSCQIENSASRGELHKTRSKLINLLAPTYTEQPVYLQYNNGTQTLEIPVRYESGLGFDATQHWFLDRFIIRLVALDPYWSSTVEKSVIISRASQRTLQWVEHLQDDYTTIPLGVTLQIFDTVHTIFEDSSGNLYFGGDFTGYCKKVDTSGTVTTITGLDGPVYAINETTKQEICLGGAFTTPSNYFCKLSGSTAVVTGGDTLAANEIIVRDMFFSQFEFVIVGDDNGAGHHLARCRMTNGFFNPVHTWTFNTLPGNGKTITPDTITPVFADWRIFVAGDFDGVRRYTTIGSNLFVDTKISTGSDLEGTPNAKIRKLKVIDGELYAVGYFDKADGIDAYRVAKFNGTFWVPLPEIPLFTTYSSSNVINTIEPDRDGFYIGANFTAVLSNGAQSPGQSYFNGLSWSFPFSNTYTTPKIQSSFRASNNSFYPGLLFGFAGAPSNTIDAYPDIDTITYDGTVPTYIKVELLSNGRLYSFGNYTADLWAFYDLPFTQGLSIDYTTNTIEADNISVLPQSTILPGSDRLQLVPGDNVIVNQMDSGLLFRITWRERFWSFDGSE